MFYLKSCNKAIKTIKTVNLSVLILITYDSVTTRNNVRNYNDR